MTLSTVLMVSAWLDAGSYHAKSLAPHRPVRRGGKSRSARDDGMEPQRRAVPVVLPMGSTSPYCAHRRVESDVGLAIYGGKLVDLGCEAALDFG
jgi:hypothetical protein